MTITDRAVVALRAHYSRDLCACGHLRQSHYSVHSGGSALCRDCWCDTYAWHPTEGDVPYF